MKKLYVAIFSITLILNCFHVINKKDRHFQAYKIEKFTLNNEITNCFKPSLIQYHDACNQYILWDNSDSTYIVLEGKHFSPIHWGKTRFPVNHISLGPKGTFLLYNKNINNIHLIDINKKDVIDSIYVLKTYPDTIFTQNDTCYILDKKRKLFCLDLVKKFIKKIGKISKKKAMDIKYFRKSQNLLAIGSFKNRNKWEKILTINSNLNKKTINDVYSKSLLTNLIESKNRLIPFRFKNNHKEKYENILKNYNSKYRAYPHQLINEDFVLSIFPVYNNEKQYHGVLLVDPLNSKFVEFISLPNIVNYITLDSKNSRLCFWFLNHSAVYYFDIKKISKQSNNKKEILVDSPFNKLARVSIANSFSQFFLDEQNSKFYAFDSSNAMLVKFRKTDFHREGQFLINEQIDCITFDSKNNRFFYASRAYSGNQNTKLNIFDIDKNKVFKTHQFNNNLELKWLSLDPNGRTMIYKRGNYIESFDLYSNKTQIIEKSNGESYSNIYTNSDINRAAGLRLKGKNYYLDRFNIENGKYKSIRLGDGVINRISYEPKADWFFYTVDKNNYSSIYSLNGNKKPSKIFTKKGYMIKDFGIDFKDNTGIAILKENTNKKSKHDRLTIFSLDKNQDSHCELQFEENIDQLKIDKKRNQIILITDNKSKAVRLFYEKSKGTNFLKRINKRTTKPKIANIIDRNLSAKVYCGRVNLNWQKKNQDETVYIFRSNKIDGEFVAINEIPIINNSYVDFVVENNRTYYYTLSDTCKIEGIIDNKKVKCVNTPLPYHLSISSSEEVIFLIENRHFTTPIILDLINPLHLNCLVNLRWGVYKDNALNHKLYNSPITIQKFPEQKFNFSKRFSVNINYKYNPHLDLGDRTFYLAVFAETKNANKMGVEQKDVAVIKIVIVDKKYFEKDKPVIVKTNGVKYPRLGYPTKIFGKVFGPSLVGQPISLCALTKNSDTLDTRSLYIGYNNEFETNIYPDVSGQWYLIVSEFRYQYIDPYTDIFDFHPILQMPSYIFPMWEIRSISNNRYYDIGGLISPQPKEQTTLSMKIFNQYRKLINEQQIISNEMGRFNFRLLANNINEVNYISQFGSPHNMTGNTSEAEVINHRAFVLLYCPNFDPMSNEWKFGEAPKKKIYFPINHTMRELYRILGNCDVIGYQNIKYFDYDIFQDPAYLKTEDFMSLTADPDTLSSIINNIGENEDNDDKDVYLILFIIKNENDEYFLSPTQYIDIGREPTHSSSDISKFDILNMVNNLQIVNNCIVIFIGAELTELYNYINNNRTFNENISFIYIQPPGKCKDDFLNYGLLQYTKNDNKLIQLFKQHKKKNLGEAISDIDSDHTPIEIQGNLNLNHIKKLGEGKIITPRIYPNSFELTTSYNNDSQIISLHLSVIVANPECNTGGVEILINSQGKKYVTIQMARNTQYDEAGISDDLSLWYLDYTGLYLHGDNQFLLSSYNTDIEYSPVTWCATVYNDIFCHEITNSIDDKIYVDDVMNLNLIGYINEENTIIKITNTDIELSPHVFEEGRGWKWETTISPESPEGFKPGDNLHIEYYLENRDTPFTKTYTIVTPETES